MPEIKKGLVIDLGSVLINECAFAIVDEQVHNTLRVSLVENLPDFAEVVTPRELKGYTLAMMLFEERGINKAGFIDLQASVAVGKENTAFAII